MDIEVFGNYKIQVNAYVYMLEYITKETITTRFSLIIIDKTIVIKIIKCIMASKYIYNIICNLFINYE